MTATESPNPLSALHVLTAHLEARARGGEKRIWMTDEARAALKEVIRMKPGRMVFKKPAPPTPSAPAAAPPAPVIAAPAAAPAPAIPDLPRSARLAAIARRAAAAPAARVLGTLRDKMVFSAGSPDASIMFVGEAPGAEEEIQDQPFVGIAGQLLTKVIQAMSLRRSDVYLTNVCKFRPIMHGEKAQGTPDRQPTADEMNACIGYLEEEIAIIQPRVIVTLGEPAAEGLLQRSIALPASRGQWLEYRGIPLMPTFHPSYLKHKEAEGEAVATTEKRKHWEDMMMVMERLAIPVTDKQRRFFLPKA